MNRRNRSRLVALVLVVSAAFAATGCGGEDKAAPAQEAAPNELDGIYRWTLTKEDTLASESEATSPAHLDTFPRIFTMTLKNGKWTLRHTEAGQASTDATADPYSVQGKRISFDWREGAKADPHLHLLRRGRGRPPPAAGGSDERRPVRLVDAPVDEDRLTSAFRTASPPSGISAARRSPARRALDVESPSERPSTRSARPRRPVPPEGSAPPRPSSSTSILTRLAGRHGDRDH